eukprot:GHRR01015535.1.p1 GENE.GHRR01015535.1~~GHRR01015535.1.p1  ORF type:complete len:231 (-),score=34.23 GHRR01015535.1:296-988(-)
MQCCTLCSCNACKLMLSLNCRATTGSPIITFAIVCWCLSDATNWTSGQIAASYAASWCKPTETPPAAASKGVAALPLPFCTNYYRLGAGGGMLPLVADAFLMPSMASTFLLPDSGVIPPPNTGVAAVPVRADANPLRGSLPLLLLPGLALPVRGTYALPVRFCNSLNWSSSAEGFSLLVAFATATSSRYLRWRSSCLFLLGGFPWNLHQANNNHPVGKLEGLGIKQHACV